MYRAERALVSACWHFSRPHVMFVGVLCVIAGAGVLTGTWAANNAVVYCACLSGWVLAASAASKYSQYSWTLPLSNNRLATVSFSFVFLLSGAGCAASLGVLNLLGGEWFLIESAFLCGLLATATLAVVISLPDNVEPEGVAIFFGLMGIFAASFLGVTPQSLFGEVDAILRPRWMHAARWPILLSIAMLNWIWLARTMRHRRIGKPTLFQWLKHIEINSLDIRRKRRTSPTSRMDAVIDLDWCRCEEAVVAGGAIAMVVMLILSVLGDLEVMFHLWLCVGFLAIGFAYFPARGFADFDRNQNGRFRWTLPVSDKELAYGLLRVVFRFSIAIWFAWVLGIVVLLLVAWVQNDSLLQPPIRLREVLPFQWLSVLVGGAIGSISLLWIATTQGLLHTFHYGCREMSIGLFAVMSLPIGLLIQQWFVPEDYQRTFLQIVSGVVGLLMMVRTARMFRYAFHLKVLSLHEIGRWFAVWGVVTAAAASLTQVNQLGFGVAVLFAGVLALALHPLASMPMVVATVRRYDWVSPSEI